jgi:hypothetical protein
MVKQRQRTAAVQNLAEPFRRSAQEPFARAARFRHTPGKFQPPP